MATHRTNVIPIIEDARVPLRYRMLVGMVDVIFADVAQPDQARIVGLVSWTRSFIELLANCLELTSIPKSWRRSGREHQGELH